MKQEQTQRLAQNDAGIKLAEAELEIARLNLSYTVIVAPCDGTTGRKEIQEGQLIQPGQTVVDLVDINSKWTANYKETQNSEHTGRTTRRNRGGCHTGNRIQGTSKIDLSSHGCQLLLVPAR